MTARLAPNRKGETVVETSKDYYLRRWFVKESTHLENGKEGDDFSIRDGRNNRVRFFFPPNYGRGDLGYMRRVGPGWFEDGYLFAHVAAEGLQLILAKGEPSGSPRRVKCHVVPRNDGWPALITAEGFSAVVLQTVGQFGAEDED